MRVSGGILVSLCFVAVTAGAAVTAPAVMKPVHPPGPHIGSLEELSIDGLRNRSYGSSLTVESRLLPGSNAYMVSFRSDGLREYARIDLPTGPVPPAGFPEPCSCTAGLESSWHRSWISSNRPIQTTTR